MLGATRGISAGIAILTMVASSRMAQAQTLAYGETERGPRFLLASFHGSERAPVDVARTPILKRRLSLALEAVTLKQALAEISEQSGLHLVYSDKVLPVHGRVHLRADGISVAAALTEVLLDANVDVVLESAAKAALVRRAPQAQAGTIVGRVTDARSGAGLEEALVSVEGTRLSARTRPDGSYQVRNVPPGTYSVEVRRIGYVRQARSVAVVADEEVTVDFAIEAAPTRLDELVTTGTVVPTEVKALPTPITVITANEIEQRHPQSLVDIIRSAIPTSVAWDMTTQPIQTNVSVRGVSSLSTSAMKIFIDGIEVASSSIAAIDPYSIERVEAVRGPQASAIYGADAAGGVIRIFTKRGTADQDRPEVNLRAGVGILQTPYAGARTALRQSHTGSVRGGTGDVSFSVGGGYTRLADYLPGDDISRQVTPSLYGGMHYERGILAVDVSGRYFRNKLPVVSSPLAATTGYAPVSAPQYTIQDWINETYGLRLTASPRSWWRNEVTVGIDRPSIQSVQSRPRQVTPDDTLLSVSHSTFRKVSVGYNTSVSGAVSSGVSGSLTAGVDHYDNDADSYFALRALRVDGTIETDPPGTIFANRSNIRNTGYFAQAQVGIRDAVYLTAALRAEDNSAFGRDLSTPVQPRVGLALVRQVGVATVKVRAAYGRSIRAPGSGYAQGLVSPSQINLANTLLSPERQRGWDGGIDVVFGNRGSVGLSAYDQTADDLIGFVQLAVTPIPTFQFQNIGRVSNRGLEIEGALNLGRSLQLKAQYGYVRSRLEDLGSLPEVNGLIVGDRPEGTPAHTAGATLTFSRRESGTTLTGGFAYVGSWRSSSSLALYRCFGGTGPCPESFLSSGSLREFIIDFPSFTEFNLTVAQRLTAQLEGYVAVDNLTNNEAFELTDSNPVMGRLTMVGLQLRY